MLFFTADMDEEVKKTTTFNESTNKVQNYSKSEFTASLQNYSTFDTHLNITMDITENPHSNITVRPPKNVTVDSQSYTSVDFSSNSRKENKIKVTLIPKNNSIDLYVNISTLQPAVVTNPQNQACM
jgi:hypothetical protein